MSVPDLQLRRLDGPDDVPEFLVWLHETLRSGRTMSLDTETGSIKKLWTPLPLTGRGFCRLWQVGTSEGGWAVDAQDWHGLIRHAHDLISDAENPVAFANCKYDQHVFEKEGWAPVPWHRVHDVVVMHRLVRSQQDRHGLKPAAVEELGAWAGAGQAQLSRYFRENGVSWEDIPTTEPTYWAYGIMDVCLTVLLHERLMPEQSWWYDVEMEYQRLTYGMERRGLRLDPEAVEIADAEWTRIVDYHSAALKELGFDRPNSNKAVITAFESLGFEPWEFSEKTGDPTYNKVVLSLIQSMGGPVAEAAEHLIAYRQAATWRNNYGRKLLGYLHGDDMLHPQINTMQARTGRSSITDPPLQTIPKRAITRNMFVPARGRELWAIDYSSQETRVLAALSGDPAMVEFFQGEDSDYHQYVADLANIPRPAAKVVNYARAYGAGLAKLAASAGVDQTTMQGYLNEIDAAFPKAIEWKDNVTAEAENRAVEDGYPWVALPYGRIAALHEGKEFTQAANTLIQGHGADVLKLAACRIAAAGYEEAMVLPVHDEFLFQFPEGEGQKAAEEIAVLMQDDLLVVPLTTDTTGPLARWGEASE